MNTARIPPEFQVYTLILKVNWVIYPQSIQTELQIEQYQNKLFLSIINDTFHIHNHY